MQTQQSRLVHATQTSNLADLLERILDKGIVIAGDIKIKLVDIELLSIQIRLLICSVDKAKEMGMDWWLKNPDFTSKAVAPSPPPLGDGGGELEELRRRIAELERRPAAVPAAVPVAVPAAVKEE